MKPATLLIILLSISFVGCGQNNGGSNEINYPSGGNSSLQEAIDNLSNDGTINIEPGIYDETISISGKIVHLKGKKGETIINGQGITCITIRDASGSSISGLTIINGKDGISTDSYITIEDNMFLNNGDGVDYESGGGILRNNTFHMNLDDAIDLDNDVAVEITMNIISTSKDDGIEIRLHDYNGPSLLVTINKNTFKDNQSNGIQIIDYETVTDRIFKIEENTFIESGYNEISFSDNQVTTPSFDIGEISEPVMIFSNVFYPSVYSFTGSGENTKFENNFIYNASGDGAINSTNNFAPGSNFFIQVF